MTQSDQYARYESPEARSVADARRTALALYLLGAAIMTVALMLRAEGAARRTHPLAATAIDLGHPRRHADGTPRLDWRDPLANAAVLTSAIAAVPSPGTGSSGEGCSA